MCCFKITTSNGEKIQATPTKQDLGTPQGSSQNFRLTVPGQSQLVSLPLHGGLSTKNLSQYSIKMMKLLQYL